MTRSASTHKEAGIIVYLQEELTDARMRCDQLKKFVDRAVRHISDSPQKDHFYEVAGDLIYGIPDALFRLDKALDATALAAARLDYEELKQSLKPEKVELLEEVLKGVRVRHLDRRAPSAIKPSPEGLAFPQEKTAMFKAASKNRVAEALYRIASGVEAASLSPVDATMRLHRVLMALAQTPSRAVQAMGPIQADSREKVMEGFKGANPDLTDEQLEEIADQWEANKDVVKDKQAAGEEGKAFKELLMGHKALARARFLLEDAEYSESLDDMMVDLDKAQMLVAKCLDRLKSGKTAHSNKSAAGLRSAAISEQGLVWDAEDLVASSDIQIRKLQIFTRECKGRADLATPLKYVMKWLVDADASLRGIEHTLKSGKKTARYEEAGLRSAAISEQGLVWDAEDLVASSDIQIRKLQIFTRECKGRADLATPLKYVMKWLVDADASLRGIEHTLKSGKKTARYEEGKSADPTQNMSEEDAAEWKKQTEENKDNFKSAAGKAFRYPEGQMTEEDWVDRYAESVEEYRARWTDLFDRRKFNSLEGFGAQQKYEDDLKLKAQKPRFRAWKKGKETYQDISKATFEWAKKRGIKSE
jgi:hypothetical protein